MQQCFVISFTTPDQYQMSGLWFGPQKAERGFIFIHGLSSSAFAHHDILIPLIDDKSMALFFNNRGHDKIGSVRKLLPDNEKGYETYRIGAAHEVFTDCINDIEGAINYLKDNGVKDIYLVGHSTGCQKSIYYLSKGGKDVKGVVLLCPVSDYAYAKASETPEALDKGLIYARNLVASNRPHELLPSEISEDLLDAQRYLSLYDPNSEEEIFSYSQPDKSVKGLKDIEIPILALFAENDEYADRPAKDIIPWFSNNLGKDLQTNIINGSRHNMSGYAEEAAGLIRAWT